MTANLRGFASASATAADIRARIFAETGLTASAGISYNKFLAKLASDYRKPNGQFVVTPAMGEAFIEALPVRKFHGVGPVTAAAAAVGVRPGMRLGEALAMCPPLVLVEQDPAAAEQAWEEIVRRLEDEGFAVELAEPGRLYFETRLSKDNTVACATCHDTSRGFGDRRATSEGIVFPSR